MCSNRSIIECSEHWRGHYKCGDCPLWASLTLPQVRRSRASIRHWTVVAANSGWFYRQQILFDISVVSGKRLEEYISAITYIFLFILGRRYLCLASAIDEIILESDWDNEGDYLDASLFGSLSLSSSQSSQKSGTFHEGPVSSPIQRLGILHSSWRSVNHWLVCDLTWAKADDDHATLTVVLFAKTRKFLLICLPLTRTMQWYAKNRVYSVFPPNETFAEAP